MNRQTVMVAYREICQDPDLTFEEKKEMVLAFLEDAEASYLNLVRNSKDQSEINCHLLSLRLFYKSHPEKEKEPELKSLAGQVDSNFLKRFDEKIIELYGK